jgi:hypothetical protein
MNTTCLDHSRLQAPREDRTALIEPPFDRVPELVDANVRLRDQTSYDLQGRSLADVSRQARTELLDAARRWTAAYHNVPAASPNEQGLIFLAGHQPQMFHPGVWFKNFALGKLAASHGATAVNLIIDGDTLSEASLRVPGGAASEPNYIQISFDRPDPRIPYEERRIEDRELFASFGARVVEQIAPLVSHPLIGQYWPLVQARAQGSDNLGAALAQARHQLEGKWGLETLEVPQSWVCSGEAFQWFVAHLLARLPRFRTIYNQSLHEYRRLHRVRSPSHPAPDLADEGPWLESPLWVWAVDDPHRRRLFVRTARGETILTDRQSWEARLPLRPEGDATGAVERLVELGRGGVRIRPRALMTTLWARLSLGDLFIHGIGGAKYDCVTDRLIERFFGLSAPGFMVVSATLHLPIKHAPATAADARAIEGELRDMTYHPEQYVTAASVPDMKNLIAEKRRWIETAQTRENARRRCQAIREINAALQPWLEDRRRRLLERQTETTRILRAQSILGWREYAFCLHPEPAVREFLSQVPASRV